MNRDLLLKKTTELFQELLDDESIVLTEEITAENAGYWDSLFHITLIASVEDVFQINLSTDDILNSKSVHSLLDIIAREMEKK